MNNITEVSKMAEEGVWKEKVIKALSERNRLQQNCFRDLVNSRKYHYIYYAVFAIYSSCVQNFSELVLFLGISVTLFSPRFLILTAQKDKILCSLFSLFD